MDACLFKRGDVWYLKWKEPGIGFRKRSLGKGCSVRKARAELRLLRERLAEVEIFARRGGVVDVVGVGVVRGVAGLVELAGGSSGPGVADGGVDLRGDLIEVGGVSSTGDVSGWVEGLRSRGNVLVGELVDVYLAWVDSYYVGGDGELTGEVSAMRAALAPLKALYGGSPCALYGPVALKRTRDEMIGRGWVRSTVNRQVSRVRRCFKWGVENELVSPLVWEGLRSVASLRRGRSGARESLPVAPVPQSDIDAVREFVSVEVWGMIQVGLLSGARPDEVCGLKVGDIDRRGKVWEVVLDRHKTWYVGKRRVLFFGPRAQGVLRPFLEGRGRDEFVFRPGDAVERVRAERRVAEREFARARRRKAAPRWRPGERYTVAGYRRAIARACEAVNRERVKAGAAAMAVWSPNQLRHNAATLIRREFGLDVAQAVLGHSYADVTQVYAEVDRKKAVAAVLRIG